MTTFQLGRRSTRRWAKDKGFIVASPVSAGAAPPRVNVVVIGGYVNLSPGLLEDVRSDVRRRHGVEA